MRPIGWQTFCGKDSVQRLNNCKRWACQDVYVCPSHHFGTHAIIGIDLIGGIRLVEMRKADGAGGEGRQLGVRGEVRSLRGYLLLAETRVRSES